MLVVGPSVKALPQLQMLVSLSPLSAQVFHVFSEIFFLLYVLPCQCLNFFNLAFTFAPNSGALAEAHGPTPLSPMPEPNSFPYHLCGQRKSH